MAPTKSLGWNEVRNWFKPPVLVTGESTTFLPRPNPEVYVEWDDAENKSSALPPDERIQLHSIFVAECFPPSLSATLIDSVRRNGWNVRSSGDPLDSWIDGQRSSRYSSGWISLGRITNHHEQMGILAPLYSQLPSNVTHAYATLFHLFPGLFVLVVQFVLNQIPGDDIGSELSKDRQRRFEEIKDGYRHFSVISQKEAAIEAIRSGITRQCVRWFQKKFPGSFALTENWKSYPTCEILTVDIGNVENSSKVGVHESYLELVGCNLDHEVWRSDDLPGLFLRLPDYGENPMSLALFGNTSRVFEGICKDDESSHNRHGLTVRLQEFFAPTFTRWALEGLVGTYQREYSVVRDKVTELSKQGFRTDSLVVLSDTETALQKISGDSRAVVFEGRTFCNEIHRYSYGVKEFVPVVPIRGVAYSRVPVDAELVDSRGSSILRNIEKPSENLFEITRHRLLDAFAWVEEEDKRSAQLTNAQSSIYNSKISRRLAETNLKLQIWVFILSLSVFVLAIVQIWMASH